MASNKIPTGTRLEIFWACDDCYYLGKVTAHHKGHLYTIEYNDGDVERKLDLSKETYRIVTSTKRCASGPPPSRSPPPGDARRAGSPPAAPKAATVTAAHKDRLSEIWRVFQMKKSRDGGTGARLAIYSPERDRYHAGSVVRHHQKHVYTIRYDRQDRPEKVNLARHRFRVASGTPELFDKGDQCYEIYWGEATWEEIEAGTLPRDERPGRGWQPFHAEAKERIRFYSCSFASRTCEVEWSDEGVIYATCFRKMGTRKRKPVDIMTFAAPPKIARKRPRARASKPENSRSENKKKAAPKAAVSKGCRGAKTTGGRRQEEMHYITDKLNVTRETVVSSLPAEIRDMVGACCWVPWKGLHRPALCLSPFEVSGNSGIVKIWLRAYEARHEAGTLQQMPHLVYWYEEGWKKSDNHKAFSLARQEHLVSYDVGIVQGWDKPTFLNKVQDPIKYGTLTEQESNIITGIKQMTKDQCRAIRFRGGPMFFPHLRASDKKAAEAKLKDLKKNYEMWTASSSYKKCLETGNTTSEDAQMSSLELCAGAQGMSKALKSVGFDTTTLDNDLKLSATSKLSLGELEEGIINGSILEHPHLGKTFSVVWAAPECRTWSIAQSGSYRNIDFIDGFQDRALQTHAQQARQDIESLVNILSHYRQRNKNLIMVIENPVGYLQHHPVSGLFETILGLTRVKISYCQFSTGSDVFPQKDTYLWTNSSILVSEFGSGEFECCKDKHCKGKGLVDGKHIVQAQDLPDKCSAYPPLMCQFVAQLLGAEYLKINMGHGRHKP